MQLLDILPTKTVLEEVFNKVMSTSVITSDEQQQIRRLLLTGYLDDDEYAIMETLVNGISCGSVKFLE